MRFHSHKSIFAVVALALLQLGFWGPSRLPPETILEGDIPKEMVGYWYGEITEEDGTLRKFFCERKLDGTFYCHHKEYWDGELDYEWTDHGRWFRIGNYYRILIDYGIDEDGKYTPEDIQGEDFWLEDYLILEISQNRFRYRYQNTGTAYTTRRVDKNFRY